MKQPTARPKWFSVASLSCAAAIGIVVLGTAPASAQTAGAPEPGCTMANMTQGSSSIPGSVGFACVADLDGNGTSEIVVGAIYNISGQGGYVLYITNNGAIRRKVCWGTGGCPTSP